MMQKNLLYFLITFLVLMGAENLLISCKSNEPEIAKSAEKAIRDVKIEGLSMATATFDGNTSTYSFIVPRGTDLKALPVSFTLPAGATSSPKAGSVQDFSQPVTYTITAEDGSTQIFNIVVQVVKSSDKMLNEVKVENLTSAVVSFDAASFTYSISVPSGTDIRALTVVFAISPGANALPHSGSSQDFTNPVNYTVTAEDGTKQVFTIRIQPTKSTEAKITSFLFMGTVPITEGIIAPNSIELQVPRGTDVKSLVPTIAISKGATISPTSGIAQDFSQPVLYRLTAEDGITKTYYWVQVKTIADRYEYLIFDIGTSTFDFSDPFSSQSGKFLTQDQTLPSPSLHITSDKSLSQSKGSPFLNLDITGLEEAPLYSPNGAHRPTPLTYRITWNSIGKFLSIVNFGYTGEELYRSYEFDPNGAGSITFTRIDDTYLEGYFEFDVKDLAGKSLKIRNGLFKINRKY